MKKRKKKQKPGQVLFLEENFGDFAPSKYQQAIFDWIKHGQGHAVVHACAGSGKTTTLEKAAERINCANGIFMAFSKHIVDKLAETLQYTEMVAKTCHSVGNGAIIRRLRGKTTLVENKYRNIASSFNLPEMDKPDADAFRWVLSKAMHFLRVCLINENDRAEICRINAQYDFGLDEIFSIQKKMEQKAKALAEKYRRQGIIVRELEVSITDLFFEMIPMMYERGEEQAAKAGIIDYDDMIWLPSRWQLPVKKYQWVLVDECQDLSLAQLELVMKFCGDGGRMLFVGDSFQAIFGFSGADCDSFWKIKERTNATELPLSICYRCPKGVIRMAQKIVPSIEARPDAPEGTIRDIFDSEIYGLVKEGDFIICRKTAPLVRLCIDLIGMRIPARVRGRDIGATLVNHARKVALVDEFQYAHFPKHASEYLAKQIEKLSQQEGNESKIESLSDRHNAVCACFQNFRCTTADELCNEIEKLFSDDRESVLLSTVHRAKGLEAERVFILYPEFLPLVWKHQKEWEYRQEINLKYVALTRTKSVLYLVHEKKPEITPREMEHDLFGNPIWGEV